MHVVDDTVTVDDTIDVNVGVNVVAKVKVNVDVNLNADKMVGSDLGTCRLRVGERSSSGRGSIDIDSGRGSGRVEKGSLVDCLC